MSRLTRLTPLPILALVACGSTDDRPHPADTSFDAYDAPSLNDTSPIDVPIVSAPDQPPVIPIGLDAYRLWDRWPTIRIGARAYMRSTFDRTGGNGAADAAHFLRRREDGAFVPLDVAGKGVLYFVRTNHWHGSPWHYTPDGLETIVSESTTADPTKPVTGSTFIPEALFPAPLAFTWSTTKGADLSWVPIPFERTFELAYGHSFYGTGYYIFQLYTEGAAPLSRPIATWDGKTPPGDDVLTLISAAGGDLAPMPPTTDALGSTIDVPADSATTVLDLESGPRTVRALKFVVPRDQAIEFGRARVRITWDDRKEPSVDAPVALFFGAGTLYNRTGREFLVKGFPVVVRYPPTTDTVELSTYFPMPYFRHAKIELVGAGTAITGVRFQVRTEPYVGPKNHVGYLHATFRDHPAPVTGKDNVFLDTRGVEGSTDWCGSFVGTSFQFSDRAALGTLEGDPRFFFDDSQTPQAQGTGTEEWGGGGDYWGGETMTLPFAGHPTGAIDAASAKNEEDKIESAYRFLLADLMPFGRNALIRLEHGGENNWGEHYRSVTFWYGLPGACLVKSDELHVGDLEDEKKHRYVSPDASPPEEIVSRFEWGVDHDRTDGKELYPATSETGRHTTGTSELTLQIPKNNFGVMLRRTFDQSFVDQRAEVWIAEDREGARFDLAGVWYYAGSNTCLFGWTGGTTETTNGPPIPITSNRRFREEEFLVPRALTEGRGAIRVRIVPTGAPKPLQPGAPTPPRIWSEIRYHAYAWVLPAAPI